jgi:glycosyltransferase involved in cell wall biosynthesis
MRCRLSEVDATQLLPNAKPANVSGISIIIPAHNAEATLEVTLNSVLSQTHTAWEAVIIDHGSTDATHAMAEGWALRDRRFRVLHQEKSGVSTARNSGLQEARYPFVLFLDSDDRIAPTHLERMAGMLLANSRLDAVHCGWQRILPSGALGPPHLGSDEEDLFEYFAFQCIFAVHACILRRELALAVGGFHPRSPPARIGTFFSAWPVPGHVSGACRRFWPFTTSTPTPPARTVGVI